MLIFHKTWLQPSPQLQQASCNSCYFSFKLERRYPLPGAHAIHHLHGSALLLVFSQIPAYVPALATFSWCLCQLKPVEGISTCLPRQSFDVPLPVPASVSITLPKHTQRVDSRSHLSAYPVSCPSPICIASSGVLIYLK